MVALTTMTDNNSSSSSCSDNDNDYTGGNNFQHHTYDSRELAHIQELQSDVKQLQAQLHRVNGK